MNPSILVDWRARLRQSWHAIPGDLDASVLVDVTADPLSQSCEPQTACGVIRMHRVTGEDDPLAPSEAKVKQKRS